MGNIDLFQQIDTKGGEVTAPLADRIRPRNLDEFVGQKHLLGPGRILSKAIENDEIGSLILWGPPGSGKTTLAYIIAVHTKARFVSFSAVISGIKEIKEVVTEAQSAKRFSGQKTILFVDEIHRFNKAQQDAFLPHVEKGTIILIGATTENPSFEVNSALLSRTKVLALNPLRPEEIEVVLERALTDKERGYGELSIRVEPSALEHLCQIADGDARRALNALEIAIAMAEPEDGARRITLKIAEEAAQKKALLYDKTGEEHFNLISALHKSLRGSDPDAAVYWLARMLQAGEDPLYIARRMVRFAAEDIGLADPRALSIALAAKEAYHFLGSPEGELALAEAAIYLATAPKSNSIYAAYNEVTEEIQRTQNLPVPHHIRNAPTTLMKNFGYGRGYLYAHDFEENFVAQEYLPDNLRGRKYYRPTEHGYEKTVKERIKWWEDLKRGGVQKKKEDIGGEQR